MRYPHARKGIAKLFVSEILQLIGVICVTVSSALIAVFALRQDSQNDATFGLVAFGLLAFSLISAVLMIISMIFNLIGVIQSSKDEPSFKVIIYIIIVGLVSTIGVSVANAVIAEESTALNNFAQVVSDMVHSITTILIIQGITNMATTLGNEAVCKKGQTLFHLIIWIALINIAMKAVILCIPAKAAVEAEVILMVVTAVLSVIQYIIYLSFLSKASKMLKQS